MNVSIDDDKRCQICGEPMPKGEEMFNYHGYSGPCPKPSLVKAGLSSAAPSEREAEHWAKVFHDTYERLAPSFGYETRKESAKPWAEVPENNRKLMTAVVAEVLGCWLAARAAAPQAAPDRERWRNEFPCTIVHQSYPEGTTCLECREYAVKNEKPHKFCDEFRQRYINYDRKLFCYNCWSVHLLFDGAAAVPAPRREIDDTFVAAVEDQLGMGHGAWDMVAADDICKAVLAVADSGATPKEPPKTAGEMTADAIADHWALELVDALSELRLTIEKDSPRFREIVRYMKICSEAFAAIARG